MSFVETIIRELSAKFGLDGHAGALAMEALRAITSERRGGLSGFLSRFQTAGLGDLVNSWIGKGENKPVTVGQLETVLGGDFISSIASKVGLSASTAGPALAFLIPKLIDKLTPDGRVPAVLPPEVSALLSGGGAPRAAATATTTVSSGPRTAYAGSAAAAGSKSGGGFLRKLIPLLGLLLLGLLAYWFFDRDGEQTIDGTSVPSASAPSTTMPSATATAPTKSTSPASKAEVAATPSQLALRNTDGRILYSGTVPDGQSRSRIIDALHSVFGASAVTGGVTVDPSAAAPTWLDKLTAALGEFKIPGAEMLLKGDSIDVGGLLSDERKNGLVASLKSIFGDGFSVGTLKELLSNTLAAATAMVAPGNGAPASDAPSGSSVSAAGSTAGASADGATGRAEQAARAANEKSLTALQSLRPGYSAEDLVKVLNASVIHFETGSAVIPASNEIFLRTVARAIADAPPGSLIEIGGHTDATGNADANVSLSQARADAVRNALTNYGADPAMLTAKGYGGTRPVASNDSAEGRDQNRRIEFIVLK